MEEADKNDIVVVAPSQVADGDGDGDGDGERQGEQRELVFEGYGQYEAYSHLQSHEANCVFHLQAPVYNGSDEGSARGNLDLVVVVDVSGSMAGEKLKLSQIALEFLLTNLTASDRMALVVYDTNVRTIFELTHTTQKNKDMCLSHIRKLKAGSRTNLSGGLFEGMQMMQTRPIDSRASVSSVLLMTDGVANVGVCGDELVTMVSKLLGKDPGYTLYTFGYGSDHNEKLLRDLSETSGGMYYYIENNDTIPEAFADCLGGLLTVVGQNLKLTISVAEDIPGVTITKVHTKQTCTVSADRKTAEIALGDIQSEEQRDVIVEYHLPEQLGFEALQPTAMLTASLTFLNAITSSFSTLQATVSATRPSEVPAATRTEHPEVAKQLARIAAVSALESAMTHARRGSFTSAQEAISVTADLFRGSNDDYICALRSDLMETHEELAHKTEFNKKNKFRLMRKMQGHARQRCNVATALSSSDEDSDDDDNSTDNDNDNNDQLAQLAPTDKKKKKKAKAAVMYDTSARSANRDRATRSKGTRK